MQFEVREDPLWLRRKHTVLVNGQLAFKATSTYFRFLRRIEVADATGRTVMSIQRKLSFLRATYEFVTGGRQTFQFRTQSLWRAVYTVEAEDGLLTVYGHRGRNHSIYRGDAQVGYFTKNMMAHRYLGMADDDQNAALLASIVITLDDYWWRDSDASITFDAGSIGPQAKRFDPAWRPKPEPSTATLRSLDDGRGHGSVDSQAVQRTVMDKAPSHIRRRAAEGSYFRDPYTYCRHALNNFMPKEACHGD